LYIVFPKFIIVAGYEHLNDQKNSSRLLCALINHHVGPVFLVVSLAPMTYRALGVTERASGDQYLGSFDNTIFAATLNRVRN